MSPACITCSRLGRCDETDVPKLLANYTCSDWRAEVEEKVKARHTVMGQFGYSAALTLVNPPKEDD